MLRHVVYATKGFRQMQINHLFIAARCRAVPE